MKTQRGQEGSALLTVAMLMLVAGILAVSLVVLIVQQNKFRTASEADRSLQQGLDMGYDKAIGALNAGSNWAVGPALTGFGSVTAAAQTDLPGLQYWVRILAGAHDCTLATGTLDDNTISAWPNTGDTTYDRTVVVHAKQLNTGREAWAVAVLHRNDQPPYFYGGDAVASGGNVTLGNNWNGHVYNSCLGPAGGSGDLPNSAGSLNVGGSITSGWPNSNWTGYNTTQGSPPNFTPLVVPSGTVPVPGYTTSSAISKKDITLTNPTNNSTLNFQAASLDLGSKTITVNGPGMVALWLTAPSTGSTVLGMQGSSTVTINLNGSTQCCLAKMFTIYVTANDPSTSVNSIVWGGTPNGSFMLIGPLANMSYNGGGSGVFHGALVVKNLTVAPNSNATFYYDACLQTRPAADNYAKPPVITLVWHRIR